MKRSTTTVLYVLALIATIFLVVYGSAWLQAPPDGPVITTLPGYVIERKNTEWHGDSRLFSSWIVPTVFFEDISGREYRLVTNDRHDGIYKGDQYIMQYQEQWRWSFRRLKFQRQNRIISMRVVTD